MVGRKDQNLLHTADFRLEIEKSRMMKHHIDISAKLKSMGLTDEAIEYALKTPKAMLKRYTGDAKLLSRPNRGDLLQVGFDSYYQWKTYIFQSKH